MEAGRRDGGRGLIASVASQLSRDPFEALERPQSLIKPLQVCTGDAAFNSTLTRFGLIASAWS